MNQVRYERPKDHDHYKCPNCGAVHFFGWMLMARSTTAKDKGVECSGCGVRYPMEEDGLPVRCRIKLWKDGDMSEETKDCWVFTESSHYIENIIRDGNCPFMVSFSEEEIRHTEEVALQFSAWLERLHIKHKVKREELHTVEIGGTK